MSLLQYIQGFRRGKDAHRLEREAMQDSFLADALEGYDKVKGNHLPEIEKLQRQITQKSHSEGNKRWYYWSMAASILLTVSIGGYFFFRQPNIPNEPMLAEQPTVTHFEKQVSEPELLAQNKETIHFTPPVIVKEEEVADDAMMQAEVPVQQDSFHFSESISKIRTDSEEFLASAIPKVPKLITGKVVDENGEPIIGASIRFGSKNQGTITDMDGNFTIDGIKPDKLNINYLGYEPVTLPVDTTKPMLIAMNESKDVLSEVVVVGYGTQKKFVMSGTVSNISAKKESFDDYVKKNLIHPTDKECKNVKGKVTLRFYVDANGRPYDIMVKKSLCSSADKEAIRLLEEGPDWSLTEKTVTKKIAF